MHRIFSARIARKAARGNDSLNLDPRLIKGFGHEWLRFTNEALSEAELREMFDRYTEIFPWEELPAAAEGFDAGCGSGRWARFFAPRVGKLHCIDASESALDVARRTLAAQTNVEFRLEDVSALGLEDASCDFGYALGVLHHIPDTERAMAACATKLKPGAPFLVYLYHDLGDRGWSQRCLLRVVSAVRFVVARLPSKLRWLVTDALAIVIYWPLARVARLVERSGREPSFLPLFQYRHRSFYVMRNDALDRFGTRLEKRYSKEEVCDLLEDAGLENAVFSEGPPWWVAVAWRRTNAI